MIYLTFSVFWYYNAPEDEKYLYEDVLDWGEHRLSASIWAVVALGVVVPLAALVHLSIYTYVHAASSL